MENHVGGWPSATCPSGIAANSKRHLKDCPPCLAYLETLKSTVQACQEYAVAEVPPPSPRVRAALLEAMRKSRKR